MLVDPGALIVEIVGADDRGIAAGVAAAEPTLLEHRNVGDPVDARQIVRGRQPVTAGANDDGVVCGLRRRIAPLARPTAMAVESLQHKARKRETTHARTTSATRISIEAGWRNVADAVDVFVVQIRQGRCGAVADVHSMVR